MFTVLVKFSDHRQSVHLKFARVPFVSEMVSWRNERFVVDDVLHTPCESGEVGVCAEIYLDLYRGQPDFPLSSETETTIMKRSHK